jgi:hypothetical protein
VINHDTRTIKERLLSKVAARGMQTSLLMDELHQEGFRQAFFEHQDLRRSGEIMEIEYTIDGVRHGLTVPKDTLIIVHGRYGQWTPPKDDCEKGEEEPVVEASPKQGLVDFEVSNTAQEQLDKMGYRNIEQHDPVKEDGKIASWDRSGVHVEVTVPPQTGRAPSQDPAQSNTPKPGYKLDPMGDGQTYIRDEGIVQR